MKAPLIVTNEAEQNLPTNNPDRVTKANVAEKYRYRLQATVRPLAATAANTGGFT